MCILQGLASTRWLAGFIPWSWNDAHSHDGNDLFEGADDVVRDYLSIARPDGIKSTRKVHGGIPSKLRKLDVAINLVTYHD